MARVCYACGKKPLTGNKVARTRGNISGRSKRRQFPNLQRIRIQTESGNKRVRVCTQCIRSGRVTKAITGAGRIPYGN